jgi:hypothetical protein
MLHYSLSPFGFFLSRGEADKIMSRASLWR